MIQNLLVTKSNQYVLDQRQHIHVTWLKYVNNILRYSCDDHYLPDFLTSLAEVARYSVQQA